MSGIKHKEFKPLSSKVIYGARNGLWAWMAAVEERDGSRRFGGRDEVALCLEHAGEANKELHKEIRGAGESAYVGVCA